jgi:hypothetical protein
MRKSLAQRGTRSLWSALLCSAFAACTSESQPAPDGGSAAPPDGSAGPRADADVPDGTHTHVDGSVDPGGCDEQCTRERAFVAAHSACSVNTDCVAVGNCSNADFIAVSSDARAAAEALIAQRTSRALDGPAYYAACVEGACQLAQAPVWCGSPISRDCPADYAWQEPGCSDAGTGIEAGCYRGCTLGSDEGCPAGHTCAAAAVDPCVPAPGATGGCGACSAATPLCVPRPACDVRLSVTLDGRPTAEIARDGATKLVLTATNLTDAPISFSHDSACGPPELTGLDAFDLFDECLSGACPPVAPQTVRFAAGETLIVRSALIAAAPGHVCNEAGLAPGTYTLSFGYVNVQGATVCGPVPAELVVR